MSTEKCMAFCPCHDDVENAPWLVLLGGGEDVDIIQEQRKLEVRTVPEIGVDQAREQSPATAAHPSA